MMSLNLRGLLPAGLALITFIVPSLSTAQTPEPTVSASPGGLVRWVSPGTQHCSMKGRVWTALHGVCYYPVDLLASTGPVAIARWGAGPKELARISVEPNDYGTEEITLPDIPQAHPSQQDLKRDAVDRAQLGRLWLRKESPVQFTLPLGPPVRPMSVGKSFGVKRIYNGKASEQAHMGSDYDSPVGSPILAVASGTVVLAKEMFFEGNSVFIDHGDGLISEYFHLSELKVQTGQQVKRGETLGREGQTGRATGPHLWFGVRWHDARIDPKFLLEEPSKIPEVKRVSP
jgi:hypothetical protein